MKRLTRYSFDEFVLSNSVLFYTFTKKYINDHHIAEDIIQDCFVKLWDNIDNLGHVNDAKLYMFSMLKHAALNHIKRCNKLDYKDILDENSPSSLDFFNDILESEAVVSIAKAIKSLPENSSKIMRLSLNGYKNGEIAKILNLSEDSVKSHKKRAIKQLSQFINNSKFLIFLLAI